MEQFGSHWADFHEITYLSIFRKSVEKIQVSLHIYLLAYLLTYLLTYSMVHSPSWEANWFAANQGIPRISRNPKVHYRTHKRPPPVSILGQPNPVHIPTSNPLQIRNNIIHPSTPRSPQWSLSLRFPHQEPIHLPLLTHTRHMPSLSHSSFITITGTLHEDRYTITRSHSILLGLWNVSDKTYIENQNKNFMLENAFWKIVPFMR